MAEENLIDKLTRVIKGDPWRKSRFHDMRGHFVGWPAILTDLPRVVIASAFRETLGYYPVLPWIPYPAIKRLEEIVQPEFFVLEYGAGMSTLWFAARCRFVHSIELDQAWYERLIRRVPSNVRLELRTEDTYTSLDEYPDHSFDLVVVDAAWRNRAMAVATRLARSYIYLDNPDFGTQWSPYLEAERLARETGDAEYFTGFPPATFIANQGMLVTVTNRSAGRTPTFQESRSSPQSLEPTRLLGWTTPLGMGQRTCTAIHPYICICPRALPE